MSEEGTPEYEGVFWKIEKVRIGETFHCPTLYWGSILGRKNPEETDWNLNLHRVDVTRQSIVDLIGDNLQDSVYSVLTFPHVTSFFMRTTVNGMRHSNGLILLYDTEDMSPNSGLVKAENVISTCDLEKYVDFVERHFWDSTMTVEDYYAGDRKHCVNLLESVGFGLPKLLNPKKL